jgi:mitogen-activated protein kinase binding protein 1
MIKRPGTSSSKDQPLRLERVLGMTSIHSAALASNNKGDIFYSAGNMSLRYNVDENRQKWFYHASSRAITCQTVSDDGRYLAIGERGHQPAAIVWDIERKEKLATLNAHKHGIGCLAFSPNGQFLVTVGFKHDRQLIVWEWMHLKIVAVLKLTNKVHSVSFQSNGNYFVTCGDRHLKWWYMEMDDEGEVTDIIGKPASILEDHRNAVFMDVCCGSGSYDQQVYCVTSTGILCCFLDSTRMMDKWIQLESSAAYTLSLVTTSTSDVAGQEVSSLVVGCSDGIIRVFSPQLLYTSTFPLPAPLTTGDGLQVKYPACYGLRYIPPSISSSSSATSSSPKVCAIYADHSLFVWDISNLHSISKYRSFESHRGCIWDIQFLLPTDDPSAASPMSRQSSISASSGDFPIGTFVTCGSDNTIRFWNIDPQASKKSKWRSEYSREVLHTIDTSLPEDGNAANSPSSKLSMENSILGDASILSAGSSSLPSNARSVVDLSVGIPDYELSDKHHSLTAPRSLAINQSLNHLACGDRNGRLRVFNMRSMSELINLQAHSAEILTLHFSPEMIQTSDGSWTVSQTDEIDQNPQSSPLVLLASAGRDRLMHVYDASHNYAAVKTLDNHSSSVTTVKFTFDGQRLLSCGGDRTLVFCNVAGQDISRMKSVQTPHGTINGLALESTNKFAITSGQDRRMNIWNVQTGKHMRAYKSDLITSELYKCDIDPSGSYVSACAFDKSIHLLDFFSGDVIGQVTGHSELITGIRFSPDGRYLVTIGGDGCIMMWRIGEILVKTMQDRLMELYAKAQRKESKAILRQSISLQQQALASEHHAAAAGGAGNRWIARASGDGSGYELFGKKIDPAAGDKHKLTLELSQAPETNTHHPPSNVGQLASTLEAQDSVILSGLSDDEDDDMTMLFQKLDEKHASSQGKHLESRADNDYDTDDDAEANNSLDMTQSKLDQLEKNAANLEDWLEQMVSSSLLL